MAISPHLVETYEEAVAFLDQDDRWLPEKLELQAARLLTWRAAAMMTRGKPNNLEASMAKAKTGRAATLLTQKCCDLLGPVGFSCRDLAEKWMRDAKIIDIYEGTGEINHLVVARGLLSYGSADLM